MTENTTTAPDADATPTKGHKKRNIIAGSIGALVVLSLIASCGGGGDDEDALVNADTTPAAEETTEATPAAEETTEAAPAAEETTEPEPEPEVLITVPDLTGITGRAWVDGETDGILDEMLLADVELTLGTGADLDPNYAQITSTEPAAGETVTAGGEVVINFETTLTLEEQNAIEQAYSYVQTLSFSRAGLFDQMTSEYGSQYPADVAEFAITALEEAGLVDWNAEAVEQAESYLNSLSFSRAELFDQMTSQYGSQFTDAQAEHALAAVGY